MELRTIRHFFVLADELHFGRTADRLHLTQSALSQQVKQLETELGVILFSRSTRRVDLTESGRRFRQHALRITEAADRATADMNALAAGQVGRVAVGFVGSATYDILPRVAHRVRDELPGIELVLRGEVLSPELANGVEDGTYDLALLRPDGGRPGLELTPLRTEGLVAVLPTEHRLAGSDAIDLADLEGEAFIIHPSGDMSTMHERVIAACERAGFRPRHVVEVGETATLVVFVAAGLGVAIVPEPVRSLAVAGATYMQLAARETVGLTLAGRADDMSSATARVADVIVDCAAQLAT